MKTTWTAGLTSEQKQEITADYKSAVSLRKRLEKLVTDKIDSAHRESLKREGYNSPSWAYQQADKIGYERALKEIISLISENSVEN